MKMVWRREPVCRSLATGDRGEADNFCGGSQPRVAVRPALHRGTILCRPRQRGARMAVSRTYLQRHGRLLTEGGDDASDHRTMLWSGRASGDGRGLRSGRRARDATEEDPMRVDGGPIW